MTNLPAPSRTVDEYDGDTDVMATTSSSTSEENHENRVEEEVTDTETTPTGNSKTGKRKTKSRAQIEREELADKIINFVNKEDHPVDLELAALSSKIKRKLPDPDNQDDLLDEIKDLAQSYFQKKRRNITTPTTTSTVMPTPGGATAAIMTQMPPPLQRLGQIQQQEGGGDVLIQQNEYNPTVEYVRDAATGAIFMAL